MFSLARILCFDRITLLTWYYSETIRHSGAKLAEGADVPVVLFDATIR